MFCREPYNVPMETYIKTNQEWLTKTYMDMVENVTIRYAVKKNIIHGEFTISINLNFYGKSIV